MKVQIVKNPLEAILTLDASLSNVAQFREIMFALEMPSQIPVPILAEQIKYLQPLEDEM